MALPDLEVSSNITYIIVAAITAAGGWLVARATAKAKAVAPETLASLAAEDKEMMRRMVALVEDLQRLLREAREDIVELRIELGKRRS